jgi:riboflavin kinase/FMN adenylyltransferase
VRVARAVGDLERLPRAVAVGTFDGVHQGHRRVLEALLADGRVPTVITFDPHPRAVLTGNQVELLSSIERRLELFEELGIEDVLLLDFTPELARLEATTFALEHLASIGAEVVFAGSSFRFGRRAEGDLALLEALGVETRPVPVVEGVSSTHVRQLLRVGEVERAASLLGRPAEVEGTVVAGDARGGTLGFPTANLAVPQNLLVPAFGIYAGAVGDHRAAISIGLNPHYGGRERRVEAFLLDFTGSLYGRRLIVELWGYLREERAFASEAELVDQIGRDVEQTRAAERPRAAVRQV